MQLNSALIELVMVVKLCKSSKLYHLCHTEQGHKMSNFVIQHDRLKHAHDFKRCNVESCVTKPWAHTWQEAADPYTCSTDHLHSTLGTQPRKTAAKAGRGRRCSAGDSRAPSFPLISPICPRSAFSSSLSCKISTSFGNYVPIRSEPGDPEAAV